MTLQIYTDLYFDKYIILLNLKENVSFGLEIEIVVGKYVREACRNGCVFSDTFYLPPYKQRCHSRHGFKRLALCFKYCPQCDVSYKVNTKCYIIQSLIVQKLKEGIIYLA